MPGSSWEAEEVMATVGVDTEEVTDTVVGMDSEEVTDSVAVMDLAEDMDMAEDMATLKWLM